MAQDGRLAARYDVGMEILGWIIFMLPFLAFYRLMRSSQATRDQSRYNPNEHQAVDSGVWGGHGC